MNEPEKLDTWTWRGTMHLLSLGQLAGDYQRDPREIRVALTGVGAIPRLTLNRVEYFETTDVVKALELLKELDAKREAAAHA